MSFRSWFAGWSKSSASLPIPSEVHPGHQQAWIQLSPPPSSRFMTLSNLMNFFKLHQVFLFACIYVLSNLIATATWGYLNVSSPKSNYKSSFPVAPGMFQGFSRNLRTAQTQSIPVITASSRDGVGLCHGTVTRLSLFVGDVRTQ